MGEGGIEIAVRAGDHVGGMSGGRVDEGFAASKHGEFKREERYAQATRVVPLKAGPIPTGNTKRLDRDAHAADGSARSR